MNTIRVALTAFFLLTLGLATLGGPVDSRLYATWGGTLEVDTCASAWAIKRFVDPDARFAFHPAGTEIPEGIQFDTPGADRYMRAPNRSIFETILAVHEIDDPGLIQLARIVRDIELNKWGKKKTAEAAGIEALFQGLNRIGRDEPDRLEKSFVIFDALYAEYRSRLEEPH